MEIVPEFTLSMLPVSVTHLWRQFNPAEIVYSFTDRLLPCSQDCALGRAWAGAWARAGADVSLSGAAGTETSIESSAGDPAE